jgi:hypothetical protein
MVPNQVFDIKLQVNKDKTISVIIVNDMKEIEIKEKLEKQYPLSEEILFAFERAVARFCCLVNQEMRE